MHPQPGLPTLQCWGHPAGRGDAGDGSAGKDGPALGDLGWCTVAPLGNLSQKPPLGLHGQQHPRGFEDVTSWWQVERPGDPAAAKPEAEESPDPAGSGCRHGLLGTALRQAGGVHGHGFRLGVSSAVPSVKACAGKSKKIKKTLFECPLGPSPAMIMTLSPKIMPRDAPSHNMLRGPPSPTGISKHRCGKRSPLSPGKVTPGEAESIFSSSPCR